MPSGGLPSKAWKGQEGGANVQVVQAGELNVAMVRFRCAGRR